MPVAAKNSPAVFLFMGVVSDVTQPGKSYTKATWSEIK
jgi:hypothetical protein